VNKKTLLIFPISLLLGALAGCHGPTKGVIIFGNGLAPATYTETSKGGLVVLPNGPDPTPKTAPSLVVYAEAGGSINFRSESPTTFEIHWTTQDGLNSATGPCPDITEGSSANPKKCVIPKDILKNAPVLRYYFTITEDGVRKKNENNQPIVHNAVIKPCNQPCKNW